MRLLIPEVAGTIKRRVLIGYAFDPEVLTPILPTGITPRLFNGKAVMGLCLIKFQNIQPPGLPFQTNIAPESAAHRIGVQWENKAGDIEYGVYVPEHYTSSKLVSNVGGTFFPGVQRLANFTVQEQPDFIDIRMEHPDRNLTVNIEPAEEWSSELFPTIEEASEFYKPPKGWSPTRDKEQIQGVEMRTTGWNFEPWEPGQINTTYFDQFPEGSYEYDHTIVMRDLGVRYLNPNYQRSFK